MEPISERAREALEDHRRRTGFGPGRKDAVRSRLEASIAAGLARDFVAELDQAAAEEGTGASPNTAAGRRVRIGGMLALALAAGLAGVWWVSAQGAREQTGPPPPQAVYGEDASSTRAVAEHREGEVRPTPPEASPAPVAAAPEVESETDDDVPPAVARHARPRREGVPRVETGPEGSPVPAVESTLAAELALLREARGAVATGELRRALASLERHAQRFAHGQLEPERAALRVEVLCEIDPQRGARARVEFLDRFGAFAHAKRVRALTCKSPG